MADKSTEQKGNKIALNLGDIADLIVFHPKLRAEYFANPDKVLAHHIPERWYCCVWRWVWGMPVPDETIAPRLKLADLVEKLISSDSRLISGRETYYERESFLKEGMQNPEKSFRAVFWMSIATFVIGVLLIIGAVAAAIAFDDTTQKIILSGLSGGAGVVTTLLAVFRASSREIRRINGDNAQIRMILTDFATEITHLRAIHIDTFKQAVQSNAEVRELTKESVSLIATHAMPREPEDRAQTDGKGSGAGERRQGFLRRFFRR